MNSNVTVIPARKRPGNIINKNKEKPKLRVVAYCRVSTDMEEQASSYEIQVKHYEEFISRNPLWEFAGIYADDGISGTNTKKREGFNDMINACMEGKVDMVITKSISRFARNTIDCLKFVRKLKEKNIPIIFEKENINTMEASGELLLTIMASLAQQESASLSQNVKLGLQFRYQEGKFQLNTNHFLGYTKDEDGNLIIEPNEAKVIKRIYLEFLDGASLRDIAKGLERDGIKTGGHNKKWHLSTIRGILCNEKYMGDALLQKTITTDFIEKVRIKNDGSMPQYYVKDSHEAIIPKDIYVQVQEELSRRANMSSGDKKRRIYSSKYALSSICKCSHCEDIYRRTHWNARGKKSVVWRCINRMENGPSVCQSPTIREKELHDAVVKALNRVLKYNDETTEKLMENIEEVVASSKTDEIEAINKKIADKQKELLALVKQKKDYSSVADEVDRLNEEKQKLLVIEASKEDTKRRVEQMKKFINEQNQRISEYDELLVRKYIKEITIFDEKIQVTFKSGIDVDIQRK